MNAKRSFLVVSLSFPLLVNVTNKEKARNECKNEEMKGMKGMYLSMGPTGNAILSAYLLQDCSTYSKLLGNIIDGQMEVLGEGL